MRVATSVAAAMCPVLLGVVLGGASVGNDAVAGQARHLAVRPAPVDGRTGRVGSMRAAVSAKSRSKVALSVRA